MQLVSELSQFTPERETLLTIGVFDGVHLGHRHLIGRLTQRASDIGLLSGVVTFKINPKAIVSQRPRLTRLTALEEKIRLLKNLGVDIVIPLTFDSDVAELTARDFVLLLKQYLNMRGLIIGPNFALGRGREGNVAMLRSLGKELDFTVDVVEPLKSEGSLVSSTAVRQAVAQGDMQTTTRLLGRYFSLSGPVVVGKERGHSLGFPTANIEVDHEQALPADGVYATLGYVGGKMYQSVTNIGTDPTFGKAGRTVEVHILDFDGDLYGQNLVIELVDRIRGEVKFAGSEKLVAQIKSDIESARAVLQSPFSGAKHAW